MCCVRFKSTDGPFFFCGCCPKRIFLSLHGNFFKASLYAGTGLFEEAVAELLFNLCEFRYFFFSASILFSCLLFVELHGASKSTFSIHDDNDEDDELGEAEKCRFLNTEDAIDDDSDGFAEFLNDWIFSLEFSLSRDIDFDRLGEGSLTGEFRSDGATRFLYNSIRLAKFLSFPLGTALGEFLLIENRFFLI